MAGGSIGPTGVAKERAGEYKGRVTAYVIIACLAAAVGGSLFGYDIGISGTCFLVLYYVSASSFDLLRPIPPSSGRTRIMIGMYHSWGKFVVSKENSFVIVELS